MPTRFSVDDDFGDEEEDEWDEEHDELLCLKYMFEGCSTLADLSVRLRGLADDLDRMSTEGWELLQPVDGGHAHLIREVV